MGFLKNEPALLRRSYPSSTNRPFVFLMSSTASLTCARVMFAVGEKYRFRSWWATWGHADAASLKVTPVMIYRPAAAVLKMLFRYPNLHSWLPNMAGAPVLISMARTSSTTFSALWPYAPMFWTGAAPTVPGMPERHSTPCQLCSVQNFANVSQACPARAVTSTLSPFLRLASPIILL